MLVIILSSWGSLLERDRMWVLRSIWKDILWINSRLHRSLRIILLVSGIALIVRAWSIGIQWWTTPRTFVFHSVVARETTPLEVVGVILAIHLIVYIAYVIDRDRQSR